MKGFTNLLDRVNGKTGPERVPQADVDVDDDLVELPYEVRLSRPWVDIGLRVGLWVAVAFGCIGGVLALLGLTGREGDTLVQEASAGGDVPAPVARVAERAIEVWLTAESVEDPLFSALFVEQPELTVDGPASGSDLAVGRVTTVGGGLIEEDYWLVTAAVEVAECIPEDSRGWVVEDEDGNTPEGETSPLAASLDCPDGEASDEGAEGSDETTEEADGGIGADGAVHPDDVDDAEGSEGSESDAASDDPTGEDGDEEAPGPHSPRSTTLFVEVGVVGDLGQRVAVLSTPSIVAEPTPVSEDWVSMGIGADEADTGEPVARTVEEFLRAWLAGDGDTSRHVAPHVEPPSVPVPPFGDLILTHIAYLQDEPGETEVRAFVQATTPGGTVVHASYELSLAFREDRWEVTSYWGAPSLEGAPDPNADPGGTPDAEGGESEGSGGGDSTEGDDSSGSDDPGADG